MKRKDPTSGSKKQTPEKKRPAGGKSSCRPQKQDETEVVLLPVTPDKVFVFWERPAEPASPDKEPAGASSADRDVLRLHESGQSPTTSGRQDIAQEAPIDSRGGSTYLSLRQAGSSCQAEIGYTDQKGRFVQTGQSPLTETPRPLPLPAELLRQQPTEATAPPAPPPVPARLEETSPVGLPDLTPKSAGGVEEDRALPESDEFLVQKRLAIFRHLSEAVPLPAAAGSRNTTPTDRSGLAGGMPRQMDLTEISEQKFVAGISSR